MPSWTIDTVCYRGEHEGIAGLLGLSHAVGKSTRQVVFPSKMRVPKGGWGGHIHSWSRRSMLVLDPSFGNCAPSIHPRLPLWVTQWWEVSVYVQCVDWWLMSEWPSPVEVITSKNSAESTPDIDVAPRSNSAQWSLALLHSRCWHSPQKMWLASWLSSDITFWEGGRIGLSQLCRAIDSVNYGRLRYQQWCCRR